MFLGSFLTFVRCLATVHHVPVFMHIRVLFRFRSFAELNQDPTKALKPHHKPKDGLDFATQYLQGFYSVIDSEADSKASHK